MASTPFFFFFSGLLFLAWFTADVHSVKVLPDVLEGSSVVLRLDEAVTSITSILWKHGSDLAVDWNGGNPAFYNIFKDTCSLNTETGELTINNVRPEHSGVYTPDINGTTRSAMKLQVLSPVPKPSITMNCNPEKTKCTLTCTDTCKIDRTDDQGHVEVFWTLDDRRVNGSELQITKDTKEETFICSLKNSVSSENSIKLLNPLLPKKVIDVLKGSRVVLSPDEAVTPITTITWEHGDNLAVDWLGGDKTFYNIFKDTCSLNTTTGQLTINNVRPEHSGVYTPDINLRPRSAMKLRVLSPVPKPSITMNCNPEKTKCSLSCWFDRTDDLGDVEIFWILDDRHERGKKLQITKDTKEETFICSLDNSVSSENSFKLLNPFLPSVPVWKPVLLTLVPLVSIALSALVCWKWIYPKYRCYWIIREICKTMPLTECDRISAELHAAGSFTDRDQALINVDGMILRILREGNQRNLSEDSILMLLTARYVILRILQQGPAVQNSLENVEEIIEKFFKGTNDLGLSADENKELLKVNLMIFKILDKSKELQLSEDEVKKLQDAHEVILGILKERNERNLPDDEVKKLQDAHEVIIKILREANERNLSADEYKELHDADGVILRILKERNLSADKQSRLNGEERRRRNGASNDTSRPRDPAEEPLNSSSSSSEAEDKV